MAKQNIVILGAGYGGIRVAQLLSRDLENQQEYQIILINRDDYHTLMTQLYQPAVGTTDYDEVIIPLGEILEGSKVSFVKGTVQHIHLHNKTVSLEEGGQQISYRYLIIALGSVPEYFGIEGLKENSLSLSSLQSAQDVHDKVKAILKDAEQRPAGHKELTFVVGGGGLTGVEFAGELASYWEYIKPRYNLTKSDYKIILIEAADQLLPGMSDGIAHYAEETLEGLGVEVITQDLLKKVTPDKIFLASGREIAYDLLLWAGGIRGNSVMAKSGLQTDPRGRLLVNEYLQYSEDAAVYAVGDSALVKDPQTGKPVIATAQAAMQQAKAVAYNIYAEITGREKKSYQPGLIFLCISVGQGQGLGETNKFRVKGIPAAFIKKLIPFKYYFAIGGLKLIRRRGLKKLFDF